MSVRIMMMSEFIEWNQSILRKRAIDRVEKIQDALGIGVHIFFKSGTERVHHFDTIPERDHKFDELNYKLSDRWVDKPAPVIAGIGE